MTDKEVGERWDLAKDAKPSPSDDLVTIRRLIQKLVEERARRYSTGLDWAGDWHDQVTSALRDFGIDPATWDGTKSKP